MNDTEIFDTGCFSDRLDSIIQQLEINYFFCVSEMAVQNGWEWSDCESYLNGNSYNKVLVDQIEFSRVDLSELPRETIDWTVTKRTFIDDLDRLAHTGDNKYEMNAFFKKTFETINKKRAACSVENWTEQKDPANRIGSIQLWLKDRYVPVSGTYLDIQSRCAFYTTQAFLMRKNFLSEFLYDLTEIYSRHLFLPSVSQLPSTPYTGKKINIYEILMTLDDDGKMDREALETFKAVVLQMTGYKKEDFAKVRSEISNREKGKYLFLLSIIKNDKKMQRYLSGH